MATTFTWNRPAIDKIIEREQKQLIAIGFQIERAAKQYCPVDTGRLRASISTNWTDSGMTKGSTGTYSVAYADATGYGVTERKQKGSKKAIRGSSEQDGILSPEKTYGENFRVVVGTNVYYAPFIEFGTGVGTSSPFLRPAFDQYIKELASIGAGGSVKGGDI